MMARESPELQHVTFSPVIVTAQAVVPSNKPELTKSLSICGRKVIKRLNAVMKNDTLNKFLLP
jgi:hypothetical protein